MLAQEALTGVHFNQAAHYFDQAEEKLIRLDQQVTDVLGGWRLILSMIDITGRFKDSQAMLAAGQQLSLSGKVMSTSLDRVFKAEVLPEPAAVGDRRLTMVEAITHMQTELAPAVEALDKAEQLVNRVRTRHVPPAVQPQWQQLVAALPGVRQGLQTFLDESGVLLDVLGARQERQYLIVFENNYEIRPTGGFIGSLGLIKVDQGIIKNIDVHSVYDPDGQLLEFIAPPEPLTYVNNRWFLRDANWFVDFPVSAKKIADFLEKEKGPTVDGIIAMTPEVVRQLLTITGPIPMPAYEVTVDSENFIPITQQQVTYEYDRQLNRPKQFMADVTPLLLQRLFHNPAGNSGQGLAVLSQMVKEKQLLLFFRDPALQSRIEAVGWAGLIPKGRSNILHVNNANIGGHKSDEFIEQVVNYQSRPVADGSMEVELTITRTHHGPQEGIKYEVPPEENPSQLDNVVFQRVLVPKSAQLINASGFSAATAVRRFSQPNPSFPLVPDADVAAWQAFQRRHRSGTIIGQEAGYTYFANWMITKPGQTSVGRYHYRLPAALLAPSVFDPYASSSLSVIKQPGDKRTVIHIETELPHTVEMVHTTPLEAEKKADNRLQYHGPLNRDIVIGAVYRQASSQ